MVRSSGLPGIRVARVGGFFLVFGNRRKPTFQVDPSSISNNPVRASFHLIVDAAQVFADYAETDQLYPTQKQNRDYDCREPRQRRETNGGKLAGKQFFNEIENDAEECQ